MSLCINSIWASVATSRGVQDTSGRMNYIPARVHKSTAPSAATGVSL